jgi:hypothetical protein
MLTATFWESTEAIRAFAGDDITLSIVEPEAQAMLLDYWGTRGGHGPRPDELNILWRSQS